MLGLIFNLIEDADGALSKKVWSSAPIPSPATVADRRQRSRLYYKPIKAPVPIPDVSGMTVEDATATLTAAGFSVSPDTVFVVDSSHPARSGAEHQSSVR